MQLMCDVKQAAVVPNSEFTQLCYMVKSERVSLFYAFLSPNSQHDL